MSLDSLQTYLTAQAGQPVVLKITNNRWSLLTLRRRAGGMAMVRAAKMFLDAPPDVWQAIAFCIRRHEQQAWRRIRQFINEFAAQHPAPDKAPSRPIRLRSRGHVYDLRLIADQVNRKYFNGALDVPITWGRGTRQRSRRRITFGTYHHIQNVVRIHPRLDDSRVPPFFVQYIVYHELLHAAMGHGNAVAAPGAPVRTRRVVHSREFRLREREFAEYQQAIVWEKQNLSLFLR